MPTPASLSPRRRDGALRSPLSCCLQGGALLASLLFLSWMAGLRF